MSEKKYLDGTRIEDLRGMKFGKLTVIEFDWKKYENDRVMLHNGEIKRVRPHWICECDCGNHASVSSERLKSNHTMSCGCYARLISGANNSKIKTVSFEQWCLDHNHQEYLDLWDYELNNKKPNEVCFGSNKKYWFRCSRGTHDSELWTVNHLTHVNKNGRIHTNLGCRKCNSLGQYLLDVHGSLDMWSMNNKFSPYDITKGSNKKVKLICQNCQKEKIISCYMFIRNGISCTCGDGISFPEKFLINFLEQLNIEFKTQLHSKSAFDIENYFYDFYIKSVNCVVEVHGNQHYNRGFESCGGRTLKEEQANDKLKRELALANGIQHYIELDCRYSELEWIKNSIMNSGLPQLLNFKEECVNWLKCHEFATNSLAREVCDMWISGRYENITEIANSLCICNDTVRKYLKWYTELGKCTYDPKKEFVKQIGKKVEIFKDGLSLGVFNSCRELERNSKELFGVKLLNGSISAVCNGKQSHHKGFIFKFV